MGGVGLSRVARDVGVDVNQVSKHQKINICFFVFILLNYCDIKWVNFRKCNTTNVIL